MKKIFSLFTSSISAAAIVGCLLILSAPADDILADTIVLKNGRRVYGKIIGQTRNNIRVRTDGRVRSYSKRSIRSIKYGDSTAERRKAAAARKKRIAAARRRAAEARRRAEAKRKAEEARRRAEQKRKAEEAARRREAERRKFEERRKQALAKQAAAQKAAEEKRRADARRAAEKRVVAPKSGGGSPWSYVWKSALLPGWGHWSNGHDSTGWWYTRGFVLMLAAAGELVPPPLPRRISMSPT